MKKILAMLGTLSLAVSASSTVIACYDNNSSSEETPKKPSLSEVVTKTELGHFEYRPTGQQILAKLKDLNTELEIEEIHVVEISDDLGQAKISVIPNSEIYEISTLTLTFTVKKWVKLEEVILEKNLGEFTKIPTEAELKTRLVSIEKNKDLKLDQIELFKIDGKNQVLKEALVLVNKDSTIYSQGRIVLSYKLNLVDLSKVLQNRNQIGTFLPDTDASTILEVVKEKNNDLDLNEVTIKKDPTNPNVAIIKVKPESLTYYQKEIKVDYFVDQTYGLNQIMEARAKALILSDQYGLSHDVVYKQMVQNNKTIPNGVDKYFDKNPVKGIKVVKPTEDAKGEAAKPINIKGSLGDVGGILGLLGLDRDAEMPFDFDIESILEGLSQFSALNDNESKLIMSSISQIINVGLDFLSTFELVTIFELLPIFAGVIGEIVPMGTFANIKNQFNQLVETDMSKKQVEPFLEAFKRGSDLTEITAIPDLNLISFQSAMIFSLFNTLGFLIDPNYKEINVAKQTPLPNKYNGVINLMKKWVPVTEEQSFPKLDFTLNPAKVIENLLMTINILNHILTEYKTPEIDYYTNPKDKNRSQYLFSDTDDNSTYVARKSLSLVKNVVINAKGFNLAELISNIKYYFGADKAIVKYRLQQFSYVLLSSGTSYAPITHIIREFILESIPGGLGKTLETVKNVLDALIYEFFIHPVINNQKVHLQDIKNRGFFGTEWAIAKGPLGKIIRNPDQFIADIDWWFSDKAFDSLYTRDLLNLVRDILVAGNIPGTPLLKKISTMFVNLIGSEEANKKRDKRTPITLEELFTKYTIRELLTAYEVESFVNPNMPNYGSAYLDKTGWNLINELVESFGIDGTETSEELKKYNFNFEILVDILNELLYGKDGEPSWLTQALDLLEGIINFEVGVNELLDFLEFDDKTNTLKQESLIGRLVTFLYPELQENLPSDGLINMETGLDGLHNNYQWLARSLIEHTKKLTNPESIKDFTQAVIDGDGAYTIIKTTNIKDDYQLLKSTIIIIEFDPTKVVFADGTSLTGKPVRYKIIIERESFKEGFTFKSIAKGTFNEIDDKEEVEESQTPDKEE